LFATETTDNETVAGSLKVKYKILLYAEKQKRERLTWTITNISIKHISEHTNTYNNKAATNFAIFHLAAQWGHCSLPTVLLLP